MNNKKIIASSLAIGITLSNMPMESMANTVNEYKMTKIEKQRDVITSKTKKTTKVNERTAQEISNYEYGEVTLDEGEFLTFDLLYNLCNSSSSTPSLKVNTTGSKKLVQEDYDALKEFIEYNGDYEAIDLSGSHSDFIPDELFKEEYSYSSYMTEFKFPQGVKSIGNYAFYNCDQLAGNLTIPDTVTSIGDYAFSGCSSIKKL